MASATSRPTSSSTPGRTETLRLIPALPLLAFLSATLLATCNTGRAADGTAPGHDTGLAFEVVVDESHCGVDSPLQQVVRDEQTWTRLWHRIYRPVEPTPELPEVDFSREMLVAVALGTRRSGGFDVSVEAIEVRKNDLEITVRESCPPRGAMASMSLTQPLQVVRLPRSQRRVVFHEVKEPWCR